MGIWGTIIGGALGWGLGGPLGAMLGAAIGSNLGGGARAGTYGPSGPRRPPPPPRHDPTEERRLAFFVATFGVMGHIAKADGRVSESEARLAREVIDGLAMGAEERNLAVRLFNEGKSARFDLDGALRQLAEVTGRRRNLRRSFVELQWQLAWADGRIHPAEREILDRIGAFLGFSRAEMAQMERVAAARFEPRRRSPDESLGEAYEVLGVARSASDDELRSAYRRLMRQHHPDRLAAQGLPEEMKEEATRRTQDIQKAYQTVRTARKAA